MKTTLSLATLSLFAFAAAKPTVYLIRHGEKPDSGNGLSAQGVQRAQCLRNVFGASSSYNIGHILAQTPQSGEPSLLFGCVCISRITGGILCKDNVTLASVTT